MPLYVLFDTACSCSAHTYTSGEVGGGSEERSNRIGLDLGGLFRLCVYCERFALGLELELAGLDGKSAGAGFTLSGACARAIGMSPLRQRAGSLTLYYG